jgi:hypothetical protein
VSADDPQARRAGAARWGRALLLINLALALIVAALIVRAIRG